MSSHLRIIFAGTPDFATRYLEKIIQSPHQIIGVFTQPDRPAGRGNKIKESPVKQLALKNNLPIFQPDSLKRNKEYKIILGLNADIMVVVAYGLILPQEILDIPKLGCINVHFSLLPKWRGAAPVQRALLAGELQTGLTIIKMKSGIDNGDILYQSTYNILPKDTSASIYEKLSESGSLALLAVIDNVKNGDQILEPQNETQATYAKKISKKEATLNWRLPALQLERQIRAFNPWPISYFIVKKNLIKVWNANVIHSRFCIEPGIILVSDKIGIQISTGADILMITVLQPEGKRPMSARDLLNARKEWFLPGSILD